MNAFKFSLVTTFVLALLFALTGVAKAEYKEVVGVGAAFNQYSTPQISGNFLYAHQMSDGIYSFNLIDVISVSRTPFKVGISIAPGVAKNVMTFNGIRIYVTGNAGAMAGGSNLGYSLSTGATAAIGLKHNLMFLPNFRVLKSSLSDTQYAVGVIFAWGSK